LAEPSTCALRLAHVDKQQRHRDERRHHCDPHDRSDVVGEPDHKRHGQQRADQRAYRIERLAQSVGRTSHVREREVGDQRVAWRTADTFTNTIDKTCREHPVDRSGQREERFGARSERITKNHQKLALAEIIAECTRENLHGSGSSFRHPFNDADRDHGGTQGSDHKYRQQAVNQL
jgi:hypothetical protein